MYPHSAGQLLLDCLSSAPDAASAARLASCSASDWQAIVQASLRHGVTPLLYRRLQARAPGTALPASALATLRGVYLQSAAANVRLYHELGKLLGALRQAGIPVIALKGAHLAELVYANIALRPMSDVDLLVREGDLQLAARTLAAAGYASDSASVVRQAHLPPFCKPGEASVEVHWTITLPTDPFRIDVDGLWDRARPARIAGVDLLVLSPEDLLLHVCLHAAFLHHFEGGLRPFCDISALLSRFGPELDWGAVGLRARQWGARNCVYLTLRLARGLVRASVPDVVLSALEPTDLSAGFVTWARERILLEEDHTTPAGTALERLSGARRLSQLTTVLKIAFPPPQDLAKLKPAFSFPKPVCLYYLLRAKYLLSRHGPSVWRLRRPNRALLAQAERENAVSDWLASA